MPNEGSNGDEQTGSTRREFLSLTAGTLAAGVAVAGGSGSGVAAPTADTADGTVGALSFYSSASQIAPDETELADEDVALVRAEPAAFNFESETGPVFVEYTDNAMPLVSEDPDSPVVGFGTTELVADDNGGFDQDNEQFLVNLFDEKIDADGEAVIAWDEGHGQFWTIDEYESFNAYADDEGYNLRATSDLLGSAELTFPSTASQVAPSGEDPLVDPEHIVVWAEPTAENVDDEDDGAVIYDDDPIPLVSKSGNVVGFGTPELIIDDEITPNNEQFVLNALAQTVGDSGTLVWDDAHDTFYGSGDFGTFADTIESEGYEFLSSGDDILDENGGEEVIDELDIRSTASLLDANEEILEDESRVVAWAPESASNDSDFANVVYPDDVDIPLVAADGNVVGFGSSIAENFRAEPNQEFLVNVWEDRLGGPGTVLFDESHGQTNQLEDGNGESFTDLKDEAEGRGFDVETIPGSASETDFIDAVDDADAVMIVGAGDGEFDPGGDLDSFTEDERDALDSMVDQGGALFLHSESEFQGDSAGVLNEILAHVDADIRFNSDEVEDNEEFDFTTTNLNDDEFPEFFVTEDEEETGTIDTADVVAIASPEEAYTQDELDALSTHVDGGGAVLLFDESEFINEETANLNAIADELGVDFAFNPDQVEDDQNNAGANFEPTTTNFNDNGGFDGFFEGIGALGFDDADAVVITTPEDAFTTDELDALDDFVTDGGAVFLFDQSDFMDFDQTANLNEIADELDLAFRFNSDQVNDEENNTGPEFDVATTNYDADRAVFEKRENGIGIEFERGEEYFGTIVRVFDSDTFEVEFDDEYGYRDVIRHIGIDTAETGAAENDTEEWFGIGDDELDHLDTWGSNATDFSLDLMAPDDADAGEPDIDGRHVRMTFDDDEPLRGNFGRLLMYMYYDDDAFQPGFDDGEFDVNYNRETVEKGYARIYSSGFSKHDVWAADEERALFDRERVWDPAEFPLDERDNEPVEDAFLPRPRAVTADDGEPDDVVVSASDTAERDGVQEEEIPLVAVDERAGVVTIGGLAIREEFEEDSDDEEFPQVGDQHQNYPLVTNIIEEFSTTIGPVLIDGGHGQFNVSGSIPLERCQFYLRFLEGVGTRLRQVNDLPGSLPVEPLTPRGVLITAPDDPFTQDELDALNSLTDQGGVVVLMGSARADDDNVDHLNEIAAALGSDLRLSEEHVTDPVNNLEGDEELVYTSTFEESFDVFDATELSVANSNTYLRSVADDDAIIGTDELFNIIADWRAGEIKTRLFLAGINLWRDDETVLPYSK